MTMTWKRLRFAILLLVTAPAIGWLANKSAPNGRLVAQGNGLEVSTFAGNAQHTGIYQAPAATLNAIRWSTPIDLNPSARPTHYGAPLVTAANTVITPVKT